MKALKANELRDKSVPELEELVKAERASLYRARRDLVFRQTTDIASLKTRRHNIARLLTLITEKKRGGES
ncbi:MAG: 50S ribosomal protein L29 [Fimbriimonadaceae bacterium]|nr:50S ribosomal protein L29 [Fimbriimonadaceae bacterium]